MKRDDILQQILRILETWEGSQPEKRTANEILTKLEKIGAVKIKMGVRK